MAATDVDLDAAGVELGTSGLIGQMQSDDLVAEEIPTVSQGGRKREGMGLSVDCGNSMRALKQEHANQTITYTDLVEPIHRCACRLR